jgi:hypothetical protein
VMVRYDNLHDHDRAQQGAGKLGGTAIMVARTSF